jgi:hypothetical protein
VTSTARHPQTEKLVVLGFVKSGAGPVIEFLG